jgi:hypothetical protein
VNGEIRMKMVFVLAVMIVLTVTSVYSQNSLANLSNEISEKIDTIDETLSEVSLLTESDELREQNEVSEITMPVEIEKQFGFEYFPLNTDVAYLYDSNAGDTESEVNPNGDELVLTFDAGKISYEQQFFKGEDGIYLTRTESSAFLFFGKKVTYPEPVLRLPLPLQIGKKWKWEGFEIAGGDTGSLTIEGEALAEEVIMTPVGEFSCLKIQLKINSAHGSKNTVTEWLAPGIGVVKFHALLEGTGLTAFLQDLLGLDELTFDLTGVEKAEEDKI